MKVLPLALIGAMGITQAMIHLEQGPPVPAGRPPDGPLQRAEPRDYEIRFQVHIGTTRPVPRDFEPMGTPRIQIADTPIMFPLIFQGTFSRIDPDTLRGRVWLEGAEDTTLESRARIDGGHPFNTHLAVMPVGEFDGVYLRWEVAYRARVWESRLDQAAAARILWPDQWPAEVRDALEPQLFIESDDEIFRLAVQEAGRGRLHNLTPFIAAKELIRYCLVNVNVAGSGVARTTRGEPMGFDIVGAAAAARAGRATRPDMVNICTATLRAAGIPARTVIGVERDQLRRRDVADDFAVWGEFYLPGAGWIPYDIDELRKQGLATIDVNRAWRGIGTLRELNQRIPLSYHYLPAVTSESPQFPAVWGWDPRPARVEHARSHLNISISALGTHPPPVR